MVRWDKKKGRKEPAAQLAGEGVYSRDLSFNGTTSRLDRTAGLLKPFLEMMQIFCLALLGPDSVGGNSGFTLQLATLMGS